MSIKIQSSPLGVATLYDALSAAFELVPQGSSNGYGYRQWYYATTDTYVPDRETTPTTITFSLSAIDPETRTAVTPVIQSVTWYEINASGTETTIGTVTSDTVQTTNYTINTDGSLVVRKNVPYNASVSLRCKVIWSDPRNGDLHEDEQVATLSTSLAAEEVYSIVLDQTTQHYNPLSGESSQYVINARAMLGETEVTSRVKFFWYWVDGTNEVLMENGTAPSGATNPCMAYVSGQYTSQLTVDADMETDSLIVICRLASNTTATAPDDRCRAQTIVRWKMPRVDGYTYSLNGDVARETISDMEFAVKFRKGESDIDEDIINARTAVSWRMKRDNSSTSTALGFARTAKVGSSSLIASDNSRMVVTPDTYVLGPNKCVTHSGKVVTYTSGGTEYYVVGREL